MKKLLLATALLLSALVPSFAQNADKASNADSLVGEYLVPDSKDGDSKVRITKSSDGTLKCQVSWLQKPTDPSTGKPWLDTKNPDKALRSQRADKIVLFQGLKYNAEKKQWDGTKIYDPKRGIKANVFIKLLPSGNLQVKGSVMGISETYEWIRQ